MPTREGGGAAGVPPWSQAQAWGLLPAGHISGDAVSQAGLKMPLLPGKRLRRSYCPQGHVQMHHHWRVSGMGQLGGEQCPLAKLLADLGTGRTPCSNVTDLIFVPTTWTVPPACSSHPGPEQLPPGSISEAPAPAPALARPCPQGTPLPPPHCSGHPSSGEPSRIPYPRESLRTPSRSSDGGLVRVSPSEQDPKGPGGGLGPTDRNDGPQALTLLEDTGNPSSGRQPLGDSAGMEAGCWFRKSYVEALPNPVPLGTSSESLGDKAWSSQTKSPDAAASLTQKDTSAPGETTGRPRAKRAAQESPGGPSQEVSVLGQVPRKLPRGHQVSSQDSTSAGPRGLSGGEAVGTRNAGSSRPLCAAAEGPGCPGEEGKHPLSLPHPSCLPRPTSTPLHPAHLPCHMCCAPWTK